MSDHERGAYTPPTDAPLSFDARQPVRGARPIPFTLIISVLVLAGLAAAIFIFYRSGVRQAGQPPQTVGAPISSLTSAPPADSQPQDPAAGLQIYHEEAGQSPGAAPAPPTFTPPPELPEKRPQAAAPSVVISPGPPANLPPANSAPPLRPAIVVQPPVAPAVKPAPLPVAKPATTAPALVAVKPPAPKPPAPKPAPPQVAAKPGGAAVQIGAFSSQALADKGWSDAAAIAPGAAAGKGKSVEKVDKDGKTLFRTTVTGFVSRDAASAFCDKLKAAGKACFVK